MELVADSTELTHLRLEGLELLGIKFGWWRIAHGGLAIATRQLDATSVPLPADTGSYGDVGFQATSLKFPLPGCWQVTGTVGGKTLTFVMNVAAR